MGAMMREAGRYLGCHVPGNYLKLRARYAALPVSDLPFPAGSSYKVYVTCSTTPSRITQLQAFLCGLYGQSWKVHGIILNVPEYSHREGRAYSIPKYLETDPNVTVNRVARDWGPATKILPQLLTEDPETLVISVDDDNIYAQNHIENLVSYCLQHPAHAAGHRGHQVQDFHRPRIPATLGTRLDRPRRVDILAGCGSLALRPRFFDSSIADYRDAPDGAFFVDDVWISGHLARRGVPRVVSNLDAPMVYWNALNTFRSPRLDRSENKDGKNNRDVIDLFAEDFSASRAFRD